MKLFFRILLFLMVPCSLCHAGDSITIDISTKDGMELNKKLYGFNQAWPPLLDYSIKNFSSNNKIKDLNIKSLRFPGGTAANFYHWSYDGYDVDDFKMFPDMASPYRKKIFIKYGKNGKKVGFPDFMEWVGREGITPIFVLNLSTEPDFDAMINALDHARQKGVAPIYCELGNELYYKNQGGRLSNVSNYIREARKAISRLKAFDETIRTAVHVNDNPRWKKGKKWNAALAKSGLDFDAIVIHPYLKEKFTPDAYVSGKAHEFIHTDMKSTLDAFRKMFPGKKLWLTEWNIENRPKRDIHRTLYGTLFMADFFLFFLGEPDVELASQHRLFGKTHGVLDVQYSRQKVYMTPNYPYYFWEMVGRVFSECGRTSRPRLVYGKKAEKKGFTPVLCRTFYNEKVAYLLVVNRGRKTFQSELFIDGEPVRAGVREAIVGDSPGSVLGSGSNKASFYRSDDFKLRLDIPPLSINLIQFERIHP